MIIGLEAAIETDTVDFGVLKDGLEAAFEEGSYRAVISLRPYVK